DKTGTLTHGVFKVLEEEFFVSQNTPHHWQSLIYSLESRSDHPIAHSLCDYLEKVKPTLFELEEFEEIPGKGLQAFYSGKRIRFVTTPQSEKKSVSLYQEDQEIVRYTLEDTDIQDSRALIDSLLKS